MTFLLLMTLAAGVILVWSAIDNTSVSQTLVDILAGKPVSS